jgi:hypothetical protein
MMAWRIPDGIRSETTLRRPAAFAASRQQDREEGGFIPRRFKSEVQQVSIDGMAE